MSLITKQRRVRTEYKMYADISDMIKLHDDTMININDLEAKGQKKLEMYDKKHNEYFKDSLCMEDTIEEVSKDFDFVLSKEKIAYSLGYKSTDDVKDMKLSDVVDTLTQVYGYTPKENVNTKSVEQELKEMDIDIEIGM